MEQNSIPLFFNFRTWLKAFVLIMTLLVPLVVQAQTAETIFRETVGNNPLGTVAIYESNNYFDNDALTMSGSASVAKTTLSNYSGASGTNYIDNGSANDFIISGINTVDYTSIKLGFGVNVGNKTTVSIDYSTDGGSTWQALTYSLPVAGGGWVYLNEQTTGAIPASANLSIKYTASKTAGGIAGKLLIDDITLTGVYSPPPPTDPIITNFKPASGGVGTEVTIYGYNLENAFLVYFEKSAAIAEAYSITSDSLKFIVPAEATTDVIQLYDVNGEILLATSTDEFVVIKPAISSFTPTSGSPRPVGVQGDEVIITGTNLATATSVVFGGAGSAAPHYTSDIEVRVYIPDGAATGAIDVVTSAYGTATSSTVFTVNKPTVTSLNSTTGAAKNSGKVGETLVIKGQRLDVAPVSVTFGGGIAATDVSIISATELRVTVPSGAQTGLITVNTAEGTATSGTFSVLYPSFTILNTPLAPFATKVGVASESQFYIISGTNLEGGINVTAPANFQVSKDDINWTDPVFFALEDANGSVSQKYVYVRYLPGAKGTHSGNITNTSVSLTELIAVSGYTLDPAITVTGTLSEFTTEVGAPSASQTYTVSGINLEGGITVAGSVEFKVSLDNTTFTRTLLVPLAEGSTSIAETTIYVRYEPSEAGAHSASLTQTSLNATGVSITASGSTSRSSLPVELISFKAEKKANEVTLLWATASEKDNSHFEVEMAANPQAGFTEIGKVNSKTGNSAVTTNYLLKYNLTSAGTRYFRLKQVDLDGTAAYSNVVAVEIEATLAGAKVVVAPNPLNYNSKVVIAAGADGKANLVLHSMAGKQLYQKTVAVSKGQNEVQLPLYDQLQNGLYILTVELQGQRHQVKVVKQ